jgi:hypothetical protein
MRVIPLLALAAIGIVPAQSPAPPQGSAIARGSVVDREGRPLRATVQLGIPFRQRRSPIPRARTRPDGSFELIGIPPGEWPIELYLPPVEGLRPSVIYYPGVVSRDEARRIEFMSGAVVDRVNFIVPGGIARTLTIRVNSSLPAGVKIAASIMRASPVKPVRVDLDANGVATIKGLSEGRYFVAARAWSDRKAFVAFNTIDATLDAHEIALELAPAGRIAGRIVAAGGGTAPVDGLRAGALWVHEDVERNPLAPDQAAVAADGTFRIDGLFGRRQLQLIGLAPNWHIRSILRGRTDVMGTGVGVALGATVNVTIVVSRTR